MTLESSPAPRQIFAVPVQPDADTPNSAPIASPAKKKAKNQQEQK